MDRKMDKDKIRRERECILKVLEKKDNYSEKKIDIEKGRQTLPGRAGKPNKKPLTWSI